MASFRSGFRLIFSEINKLPISRSVSANRETVSNLQHARFRSLDCRMLSRFSEGSNTTTARPATPCTSKTHGHLKSTAIISELIKSNFSKEINSNTLYPVTTLVRTDSLLPNNTTKCSSQENKHCCALDSSFSVVDQEFVVSKVLPTESPLVTVDNATTELNIASQASFVEPQTESALSRISNYFGSSKKIENTKSIVNSVEIMSKENESKFISTGSRLKTYFAELLSQPKLTHSVHGNQDNALRKDNSYHNYNAIQINKDIQKDEVLNCEGFSTFGDDSSLPKIAIQTSPAAEGSSTNKSVHEEIDQVIHNNRKSDKVKKIKKICKQPVKHSKYIAVKKPRKKPVQHSGHGARAPKSHRNNHIKSSPSVNSAANISKKTRGKMQKTCGATKVTKNNDNHFENNLTMNNHFKNELEETVHSVARAIAENSRYCSLREIVKTSIQTTKVPIPSNSKYVRTYDVMPVRKLAGVSAKRSTELIQAEELKKKHDQSSVQLIEIRETTKSPEIDKKHVIPTHLTTNILTEVCSDKLQDSQESGDVKKINVESVYPQAKLRMDNVPTVISKSVLQTVTSLSGISNAILSDRLLNKDFQSRNYTVSTQRFNISRDETKKKVVSPAICDFQACNNNSAKQQDTENIKRNTLTSENVTLNPAKRDKNNMLRIEQADKILSDKHSDKLEWNNPFTSKLLQETTLQSKGKLPRKVFAPFNVVLGTSSGKASTNIKAKPTKAIFKGEQDNVANEVKQKSAVRPMYTANTKLSRSNLEKYYLQYCEKKKKESTCKSNETQVKYIMPTTVTSEIQPSVSQVLSTCNKNDTPRRLVVSSIKNVKDKGNFTPVESTKGLATFTSKDIRSSKTLSKQTNVSEFCKLANEAATLPLKMAAKVILSNKINDVCTSVRPVSKPNVSRIVEGKLEIKNIPTPQILAQALSSSSPKIHKNKIISGSSEQCFTQFTLPTIGPQTRCQTKYANSTGQAVHKETKTHLPVSATIKQGKMQPMIPSLVANTKVSSTCKTPWKNEEFIETKAGAKLTWKASSITIADKDESLAKQMSNTVRRIPLKEVRPKLNNLVVPKTVSEPTIISTAKNSSREAIHTSSSNNEPKESNVERQGNERNNRMDEATIHIGLTRNNLSVHNSGTYVLRSSLNEKRVSSINDIKTLKKCVDFETTSAPKEHGIKHITRNQSTEFVRSSGANKSKLKNTSEIKDSNQSEDIDLLGLKRNVNLCSHAANVSYESHSNPFTDTADLNENAGLRKKQITLGERIEKIGETKMNGNTGIATSALHLSSSGPCKDSTSMYKIDINLKHREEQPNSQRAELTDFLKKKEIVPNVTTHFTKNLSAKERKNYGFISSTSPKLNPNKYVPFRAPSPETKLYKVVIDLKKNTNAQPPKFAAEAYKELVKRGVISHDSAEVKIRTISSSALVSNKKRYEIFVEIKKHKVPVLQKLEVASEIPRTYENSYIQPRQYNPVRVSKKPSVQLADTEVVHKKTLSFHRPVIVSSKLSGARIRHLKNLYLHSLVHPVSSSKISSKLPRSSTTAHLLKSSVPALKRSFSTSVNKTNVSGKSWIHSTHNTTDLITDYLLYVKNKSSVYEGNENNATDKHFAISHSTHKTPDLISDYLLHVKNKSNVCAGNKNNGTETHSPNLEPTLPAKTENALEIQARLEPVSGDSILSYHINPLDVQLNDCDLSSKEGLINDCVTKADADSAPFSISTWSSFSKMYLEDSAISSDQSSDVYAMQSPRTFYKQFQKSDCDTEEHTKISVPVVKRIKPNPEAYLNISGLNQSDHSAENSIHTDVDIMRTENRNAKETVNIPDPETYRKISAPVLKQNYHNAENSKNTKDDMTRTEKTNTTQSVNIPDPEAYRKISVLNQNDLTAENSKNTENDITSAENVNATQSVNIAKGQINVGSSFINDKMSRFDLCTTRKQSSYSGLKRNASNPESRKRSHITSANKTLMADETSTEVQTHISSMKMTRINCTNVPAQSNKKKGYPSFLQPKNKLFHYKKFVEQPPFLCKGPMDPDYRARCGETKESNSQPSAYRSLSISSGSTTLPDQNKGYITSFAAPSAVPTTASSARSVPAVLVSSSGESSLPFATDPSVPEEHYDSIVVSIVKASVEIPHTRESRTTRKM